MEKLLYSNITPTHKTTTTSLSLLPRDKQECRPCGSCLRAILNSKSIALVLGDGWGVSNGQVQKPAESVSHGK